MSTAPRDPADRPNIILINCDDLGYGDLGCYGSTRNSTPALDRMAAEGVRFTDFYMASPVCSPSRGAMMTGCYPKRIGFSTFDDGAWVLFPGHHSGLSEKETTVATLLKGQGYATKLVGKWHCGDQPEFLPTRHGFDSYYGLPYSNDMGRQGGRTKYPPLPLIRDEEGIQEQPSQTGLTERYVEECVRFLREEKDGPFFLYFAHMYVHLPIYTPKRFTKESKNGRYGAAVACVDWSVSVLLDELKRLGLDENTLVLFTSDNGSRARDEGGSNDPLRGTKGTTFEGGQRLPLVARWPGRIPAGTTCNALATSMDFLPTFAHLAGAEAPTDRIIDGVDIATHLFDPANATDAHESFCYYMRDNLEAVRSGPWKLFVSRANEPITELYNLAEDVGETTDVSGQHPEEVARLQGLADAAREDLGDAVTGREGANCRPCGWVDDPKPLTDYDESHPYIEAMYDLTEAG